MTARKSDYTAIGVILLYCLSCYVVRVLISPAMELDEAEQFLSGSLSLYIPRQAPLYGWLVWIFSPLGVNVVTLAAIKCLLLFSLYFTFYLAARQVWDAREALLVTGSLLILPTYSYEINRDLTHTLLVSVMTVLTCLVYCRLMISRKSAYYWLFGVCMALGILSKYNFLFFIGALILSGLSFREGRRILRDKRIFLTILCCALILLPHLMSLSGTDFVPVRYAVDRSGIGKISSWPWMFHVVLSSYLEVILFFTVIIVFFRRTISPSSYAGSGIPSLFRWLAFYGLLIPLIFIAAFRTGHFSSRWLAPTLVVLPLAAFSLVKIDERRASVRLFGFLCIFVAVAVLGARLFIGFFPDTTGKYERIHIPFEALSQQLAEKLALTRITGSGDVFVIAGEDDEYIAANLLAWMPGGRFIALHDAITDESIRRKISEKGATIVGDISQSDAASLLDSARASGLDVRNVTLSSPYIHSASNRLYSMQAAVMSRPPQTPHAGLHLQ